MRDAFVDGDDLIRTRVFYRKQGHGLIILRDEEPGASVIEALWRQMTTTDAEEVMRASLVDDVETSDDDEEMFISKMDWPRYRQAMCERMIKSWNLEGVPCTPENIRKLNPVLLTEMFGQYLDQVSPSENGKEIGDAEDYPPPPGPSQATIDVMGEAVQEAAYAAIRDWLDENSDLVLKALSGRQPKTKPRAKKRKKKR